jgi:Zn-dependent M28 family amino/carboxypeptidase
MVLAGPELQGLFKSRGAHQPRTPKTFGDEPPSPSPTLVLLGKNAATQIWNSPDGSPVRIEAKFTPWQEAHTWNVLARLPGEDENQVVLLSAHLDHLGTVKGKMYPGADDDASGTATVMELARALAKQPKPRRTIIAALWGSEEAGLIGSRYFLQHPTFPLKNVVANLEFEMVARMDPAVKPNELWLTGWNRSNLGPELAAHGAKLVADPHSSENFFQRSDNYALAEKGIVAQTVSSFGLHQDYHQPGDTLAKVNWAHLDGAINSMIEPLIWLTNSSFVPHWKAGGQP